MFTGIIQDVGRIAVVRREPQQMHIEVQTSLQMQGWQLGDSVAVNGCCLTVTAFPATDRFAATLSPETLALTCFSSAAVGDAVNLEPALRMGDALGGHMVSGHVDGMGHLCRLTEVGEHRVLEFELPVSLARYVVVKGSVAVHGVSLTVNAVDECRFSVNLIPHTLAHTSLGQLVEGDAVNIETDMYGRYVERLSQFAGR
ncbi:riboflavin synthase [Mariprofundus erugo]|uniref:Riboflavin synthase n=1 Tax=Mariprofundus erugo TaxID=2528639 RepID=A0A5R9GNI0_9PROT|nr:riboflavin synthase [Mariprofundus erugo]TLS67901.1 riboflavin synthase [Mariprofundus erugo]TLS76663.1 riboflavin synthase [Mariprofundus erugo]